MKIVTLLARHGVAKYTNAASDIDALFARRMPHAGHETVIVDNALPVGHVEPVSAGVTLIGGSNAAWEFSAWDSAVAFLGERLHAYDFVHLATSAFRQLYVAYLERFDTQMLQLVNGRAAAVGHIDYYNDPVTLLGQACQSWLRTSFVFLPPVEIDMLGSFVSVTDRERFFSGDPAAPFRVDAPISEGYRQNILGWLTGDGTDQGTEWHSRFLLTTETLSFFESKTMAILNEQMLSNRLRARGCATVDATWLATQVKSKKHRDVLGAIPNWRAQVTSRDVDAAPASVLV
ncbi:hypothetical protein [Variovorax sp. J31P207]|uniref:hypothetical protein n=1 Tax=Variovorax sp. J31P207 TaxID=3053510 RepID=UPI00257596F4|nr:hypothetical protein [Variovorax sp. J31P207]MDM0067676.1 hypothetical protein [Variovorax sp. J31P207]